MTDYLQIPVRTDYTRQEESINQDSIWLNVLLGAVLLAMLAGVGMLGGEAYLRSCEMRIEAME